jgi:hypothetical protein
LEGGDLPNNKKETNFSAAVRGEGNRQRKTFLRLEMKRILLLAVLAVMLTGCQMAPVDDIYGDQWPYVYDYSEPVPAEAGIYRSGQVVLEGMLEIERAWTSSVKATMGQGDSSQSGRDLETALRRLYQRDLYEY